MMTPDRKTKTLMILIVMLLITNLGLLFLYFSTNKSNRHEGRQKLVRNYLEKDLGFTKDQMLQYDQLTNVHREKSMWLFDSVSSARKPLLKQLAAEGFGDEAVKQTAMRINESHLAIELNMLTQVKDIRAICTKLQLPGFDSSYYKMITRKFVANRKDKR